MPSPGSGEPGGSDGRRGDSDSGEGRGAGGGGSGTTDTDTPPEGDAPPAGDVPSATGERRPDDDWETSTELPNAPGLPGGDDGDDPQVADGEGSADGEANEGGAGDDELDEALEDLDGEILDERVAAQDRARGGETNDGEADAADGAEDQGGGAMPGRRRPAVAVPPAPPLPKPEIQDAPDARDEDVVARQIREAAMAEPDPVLREALWREYERIVSGKSARKARRGRNLAPGANAR